MQKNILNITTKENHQNHSTWNFPLKFYSAAALYGRLWMIFTDRFLFIATLQA